MKDAVTSAVKQGPRSYQEDRHFFAPIEGSRSCGWFLAVMDGHAGDAVAELCAQEIGQIFQSFVAGNTEEALRLLVAELNSRTQKNRQGSTLSIAVVTDDPCKVSVAVIGDSPVVVYDKQGKLHLSPEHNVRSNLKERAAAIGRGGRYAEGYLFARGNYSGLQMGRALGDADLDEVLSREPDIYTVHDPRWVLVASDGLFDPNHEDMPKLLGQIKRYAKKRADAESLMKWAERRGLEDNATAIVWCADTK